MCACPMPMMGINALRYSVVVLVSTWLVACVSPPVTEAPTEHHWAAHIAAISELNDWQIQGKLGVRSPAQSGSALLDWRQHDARFKLLLSGAMGIGRHTFDGSPEGIVWTDSDGEQRFFTDPDQAFLLATHIDVPVDALRFWVRGIASPSAAAIATDDDNPAMGFTQNGWHLSFDRFTHVEQVSLPTRIRAARDELQLTIVVSRWQLNPTESLQ